MFKKDGNIKKSPPYSKAFRNCINLRKCIKKDKNYFIKVWQKISEDRVNTLILMFWLIYALTLLSLYSYNNRFKQYELLVGILVFITILVMAWFTYKNKKKKTIPQKPTTKKNNKVNPVSLGTFYFSFVLSILVLKPIVHNLTLSVMVIAISAISLIFMAGIYCPWIRKFLIPLIYPYLIGLTSIGIFFIFISGLISSIVQTSGIPPQIIEIIVYFGFAWLITMLLIRFKDAVPQVFTFLFVLFFFCNAGIKFDLKDNVGGFALLIIGFLVYLVAAGHLHPYGKVSE